MVTIAQANELRRGQAEIRRLVEDRMMQGIEYLASRPNLSPEQFRNSLIAQTNLVVSQYGNIAASMAAEWYEDIRLSEVGSSFRAMPMPSPYGEDAVEGMVRRGVGAFFEEVPDLAATMKTVSKSAAKYVLGASRETIKTNALRDSKANGWQRVTRPDSCDFCKMLEGRGGVYLRETAFFASHLECNCAAVPSFDPTADEVDVEVYRASVRTTNMSDAAKTAHNARIQGWIAQNL